MCLYVVCASMIMIVYIMKKFGYASRYSDSILRDCLWVVRVNLGLLDSKFPVCFLLFANAPLVVCFFFV